MASSEVSVSLGTVRRVPVESLHLVEGNPRRGQIEVIADSLKVNGQYRPIVVNEGSLTGRPMEVLAGNHTLRAAVLLEWDELDAFVVDVDDEAAKRIVAVDNRSTDLATYDNQALLDLLESLPDLAGTGYTDTDITALQASTADPIVPDDFPGFDEDIDTKYCCPKCNYEWSGKPN